MECEKTSLFLWVMVKNCYSLEDIPMLAASTFITRKLQVQPLRDFLEIRKIKEVFECNPFIPTLRIGY